MQGSAGWSMSFVPWMDAPAAKARASSNGLDVQPAKHELYPMDWMPRGWSMSSAAGLDVWRFFRVFSRPISSSVAGLSE
jgi:hypothetical protein